MDEDESIAVSAAVTDSAVTPNKDVDQWFAAHRARSDFSVTRIPFAEMDHWGFAGDAGALAHDSGRFFSVAGLRLEPDSGPAWDQPILVQREIGILGLLVRDIDGVAHFLVQAKAEPGYTGGVRISPTVQATRSNFSGVHRGRSIPYLEHFLDAPPERVLVDSLQGERAAWFLRKRNRHLVVRVDRDVPEHDGFRWLTLGQLRRLMKEDNAVSMEICSVLACLPAPSSDGASDFHTALARSISGKWQAKHGMREVGSRLCEIKARHEIGQRPIPLHTAEGWQRDDHRLFRPDGRFFSVVAARVEANREVPQWTQPLLAPVPGGISALVTRTIDGVLHVLLDAHIEAGSLDVAEFRPTVQCTPANYDGRTRPPFLDTVLGAAPERIRYDGVISEEGARFHHAENRYLIVDGGEDFPLDVPPEFTWVSVAQIRRLLEHGYYLNMQARTLVALLHAI
ncbi:NDP-hexose 2,3-dehydratase family protein [Amycolatopsis sp. cg13]|uniref:NDP-hexose 2,3-dehydratase family protein n=1 Tax=Amycolatopsis sp. cg13 TaxID=3238807 RepID=UPI0035269D26